MEKRNEYTYIMEGGPNYIRVDFKIVKVCPLRKGKRRHLKKYLPFIFLMMFHAFT